VVVFFFKRSARTSEVLIDPLFDDFGVFIIGAQPTNAVEVGDLLVVFVSRNINNSRAPGIGRREFGIDVVEMSCRNL